MHWVFEVPVCPKCGCKSILVHPQRYTENDNWVTKDQLDADQTIKVAKTQPAIYISDESHLTCSECNFLFENEDLENILKIRAKELGAIPTRNFKQQIGIAVFNPRGLKKLGINTK